MLLACILAMAQEVTAAGLDPASPGFWRRPVDVDQYGSLTVAVVKVKSLPDAQKAVEALCRKFHCSDAASPSWYFTGFQDLRTANESYYRVRLKDARRVSREFADLGKILQFREIPMRNLASDASEDEFKAKSRNLSRELAVFKKKAPNSANILNLVEVELGTVNDVLGRIESSREYALVNLRLTEDKTY